MSLLDIESRECVKSELDLFGVPPTQTSIESANYVNYHPVTTLDRGGPIEFVVKASPNVYLDLARTVLYLKTKILYRNGATITKVGATDDGFNKTIVTPVNYFHASQFRNIEVYINGKTVNHPDNMYHYRSYLETTLTFSTEAKKGQLRAALYHMDCGDDLDWNSEDFTDDGLDENDVKNSGLLTRFQATKFSKTFETFGRIHSEMFVQPKLLPGKHELRIRLHRADPDFCLIGRDANAKYRIAIESAVLMMRHCTIAPHVTLAHTTALHTKNIKYPVRRVEMKFFTKRAGHGDITESNPVNGQIPRRIVIGLAETEAFNGKITSNPFNFKHFNADKVELHLNGMPVPFEELEMDFANDCYYQGYLSLLQGTGKLHEDQGFVISPTQYKHGFSLFSFDMTSDQSACGTFDLAMEGKLSLDIKLHSSSKRSITIIAYLEYDAIYEIDAQGNVHGNEWEDSRGKMNNLQLHNLANRCPALKEIFVGVFPSDRLPDLPFMKQKRAYALIANLDKEGLPSSHWVALYLPKQRSGTAEYFDSYGQPPTLPSFLTLLRKYNRYVLGRWTLLMIAITKGISHYFRARENYMKIKGS